VDAPSPGPHADPTPLADKVSLFLNTVVRHETAMRAYEKWIARGRPAGSGIHDWLEAEAELADLRREAGWLADGNTALHEFVAARDQLQQALEQEIKKYQEADDARQRNYALLHAIIEGTTDAVFVKDLQGKYLMINSAGARFLGLSVADVLGRDDTALFSAETARRIMAQDRKILASGHTQTVEDVGKAAGVTRIYLSTKGPYRDPQGKIIGLIGISRDMTEPKQAQRRLKAEHAVTRALAEADSLAEAAHHILPAVCQSLDWDMGIFWALDRRSEVLHCVEVWHSPEVVVPELERASREVVYSRGLGLPGEVWARGEPVWSADVTRDIKTLYRGLAAQQEGLHAAIAFPVCRGTEFLGVIEFFSREMGEPDQALLDTMHSITSQISQFMERQKAEKALHERKREFAIAQEIQQGLLPRSAPVMPGLALAGTSLPAQETGGDYYDFFHLAGGALGVAIGDASGHGIGAALLIAETRAYLRALAQAHPDLGHILTQVNRRLSDDVAEDHFVTLLLARLDPEAFTLTCSNAGHWPGYVLDFRGQVKAVLESTGLVLGFNPGGEFPSGPPVALAAGDLVLLCTDGLAEAFSKKGEVFGRERVLDFVRQRRYEEPSQIVAALCDTVREFSGGEQLDDMTAVVIKVG
jgi:PAS domain S-box-containing protein